MRVLIILALLLPELVLARGFGGGGSRGGSSGGGSRGGGSSLRITKSSQPSLGSTLVKTAVILYIMDEVTGEFVKAEGSTKGKDVYTWDENREEFVKYVPEVKATSKREVNLDDDKSNESFFGSTTYEYKFTCKDRSSSEEVEFKGTVVKPNWRAWWVTCSEIDKNHYKMSKRFDKCTRWKVTKVK